MAASYGRRRWRAMPPAPEREAPVNGGLPYCHHCARVVEPDEQAPGTWLDEVDTSYLCPSQGLGGDFPDGARWHEPAAVTRYMEVADG